MLDWRAMRAVRWSVSLVAIIGVLTAIFAGGFIWILVSDPVKGAQVIEKATGGDVGPLVQAIGAVIMDALKGLFKYL
jgi:hypothetical protein